jgi:neutral ceramidase
MTPGGKGCRPDLLNWRKMRRREFIGSAVLAPSAVAQQGNQKTISGAGKLRAGVALANITPSIGAPVAGSFVPGRSTDNHDELWVKSLVLDNGQSRIAIALVDVCVLPASVLASARQALAAYAGIPDGSLLVCCTHTHSAPATMHLFQAQPDPAYLEFITRRIVDSVRMAVTRLQPAQVGFGFDREDRIAFNRRYHLKPGTIPPNPFGSIDQVKTNPGVANANVLKTAGPTDPTVGVMSVRTADGKPLALVGNYSLHYVGGVGSGHISADYFAYWAAEMSRRLGVASGPEDPPFVAMLTNGAQGDINNIDVLRGSNQRVPAYVQMAKVAKILADASARALDGIRYVDQVELGASQEWLEVGVRLPSVADVQAARKMIGNAPQGKYFTDLPQVYARETIILAETFPKTERVPVQALRVGDVGIAAFSGEPFVELGLEVRQKSPFKRHFLVGLSNDHVGYIPTDAAHEQGGYETWRAKTSYLEKDAGNRITAAMLRRLTDLAT